jgi:hypothetical protein
METLWPVPQDPQHQRRFEARSKFVIKLFQTELDAAFDMLDEVVRELVWRRLPTLSRITSMKVDVAEQTVAAKAVET